MEIGTKYRLEREQKKAEILETRNEEIKKLLANA
jgi:hypothetical protein